MNVEPGGIHRHHVHAHPAHGWKQVSIPVHLSTTVAQRSGIAVGITYGQHRQGAVVVHGAGEPITRAFTGWNADEFGHGGFEGKDVFESDLF